MNYQEYVELKTNVEYTKRKVDEILEILQNLKKKKIEKEKIKKEVEEARERIAKGEFYTEEEAEKIINNKKISKKNNGK